MLDSGFSQMKRAFNCHRGVVGPTITHHMILFYAAEVGLKAFATSTNFQSRPKLSSEVAATIPAILSHDLNNLISDLKIPANAVGKCPVIKLKGGDAISIIRWHEAWRYGIAVEPQDEVKAVEWLKSIITFISSKNF